MCSRVIKIDYVIAINMAWYVMSVYRHTLANLCCSSSWQRKLRCNSWQGSCPILGHCMYIISSCFCCAFCCCWCCVCREGGGWWLTVRLRFRGCYTTCLGKTTGLDHHGRLVVYKGFVRPVLEYCPLVWMGAASSHLAKLDKVQQRAMRMIGPGTLLPSLEIRRTVAALSYLYKLQYITGPSQLTDLVPPFAGPAVSASKDTSSIPGEAWVPDA